MIRQVTTGASDDLRRVTAMVYQMIGVYGMGDGIGQLAFPQDNSSGYPQEKWVAGAVIEAGIFYSVLFCFVLLCFGVFVRGGSDVVS